MARPLHVLVHMASGLRGTGTLLGAPHPFAVLSVGGERYRTRTRRGHDPTWNEEFSFREGYQEQGISELVINVFNSRYLVGDCFIGSCRIKIADAISSPPVGHSYTICRKDFPYPTGAVLVALSPMPIGSLGAFTPVETSAPRASPSAHTPQPASAGPPASNNAAGQRAIASHMITAPVGDRRHPARDRVSRPPSPLEDVPESPRYGSAPVPAFIGGGPGPSVSFRLGEAHGFEPGLSEQARARRMQEQQLQAAAMAALPCLRGTAAPVSLGAICARCRGFNPCPVPVQCRACGAGLVGADEVFASLQVGQGAAPPPPPAPVLGYPANSGWPTGAGRGGGGGAGPSVPVQQYGRIATQPVDRGLSGYPGEDTSPPSGYTQRVHRRSNSTSSSRGLGSKKGALAVSAGLMGLVMGIS